MAYLAATIAEEFIAAELAFQATPIFSEDELGTCDRLEVWVSSFSDPGDDWAEYRLFAGDREIARRRRPGY